jgi:hypothetical protein
MTRRLAADFLPTLFDEVVRADPSALSKQSDAGSNLGASVRDDLVQPPGAPSVHLGPSIGDDGTPSDRRLKTDIQACGTTSLGLTLYTFRYQGGTELFEGVMAQDVLGVRPDAVSVGTDGFYRVHYSKLGLAMRRVG